MDSRWYLFPGQTLENTKISDRVHALHITKSSWAGITKHLDRKQNVQEAADKEAAVKKYLDEGSKNMTKEWENSLENVRRRKEEERLRLIDQKIEERQQRFLELRQEQEEIRTKYMDKVKKQIFMTTGHARALTSALVTSEVLFERQKQQEFMDKITQHEKEEDLIYVGIQRKKAEKEAKQEEEKQIKLKEKEKKHVEELKKIIREKAALEKSMKEERVKNEALDNIEAVQETERLKKLITEDKIRKKNELLDEKKKLLKQQEEFVSERIKEEKELDEVVQIYSDAKHRIDCMKKQREKELRDVVIKRRQKMASVIMAEQMDKSEAEEKAMQKVMAEREVAAVEKIKARREFDKKMKEERLKNRDEVLAREGKEKKTEEEIKKWEILNRYKADENMKKYEKDKKKELWQQILKYRQALYEQMEDNKLEQLSEKEINEALEKTCVKDEDTKFFEYADEVLQLAKQKGRTTTPIERVITKYLKQMNINSSAHVNHTDPCKNKAPSDPKEKLIKPCRCHCPKN